MLQGKLRFIHWYSITFLWCCREKWNWSGMESKAMRVVIHFKVSFLDAAALYINVHQAGIMHAVLCRCDWGQKPSNLCLWKKSCRVVFPGWENKCSGYGMAFLPLCREQFILIPGLRVLARRDKMISSPPPYGFVTIPDCAKST